jgi:NitT/TauT family transport system permease protein
MNTVFRYSPLLVILLAWEAAARLGLGANLALPSPSAIIAAWLRMLLDGELATNGMASLYRGGVGLALAIAIGIALGTLMAVSRATDLLLGPLVEAFYPLPKSALIPITAVWLGFGDSSKILLIVLGCMLPVVIAAYNGTKGCERALVWSARGLGATRLQLIWQVLIPNAMPEILNGIRTSLALSFILLVSAELISAREGLGYLIGFLGTTGAYDGMFAAVLTVAFLGFAADRAYQQLVTRVLRWRE